MKIIEVPIFNDDGSVQVTHTIAPEEAQILLQFALNFLTGTGLSLRQIMQKTKEQQEKSTLEQLELKFND